MTSLQSVPDSTGTYALIAYLGQPGTLIVGRLGTIAFRQGWHAYVGSAFGPGGLRARIRRHVATRSKRKHWHIDYLLAVARVRDVWWTTNPRRVEHELAGAMRLLPTANGIVAGFGASDCSCASHLIRFKEQPSFHDFIRAVQLTIESSIVFEHFGGLR